MLSLVEHEKSFINSDPDLTGELCIHLHVPLSKDADRTTDSSQFLFV